jgi:hypothetical protein
MDQHQKIMDKHEKKATESKKMIAFFVAEATWKIILAGGIGGSIWVVSHGETVPVWLLWILLAIVIVAGFVEAGTIGGITWLDKYVRVAHITALGPGKVNPVEESVENPVEKNSVLPPTEEPPTS